MYGFTGTTFAKRSAEDIVAIAVANGVQAIEWSARQVPDVATAERVAMLCGSHDIACPTFGSYANAADEQNDFDSVCQTARALGASIIRVWCGHHSGARTSSEEYTAIVTGAQTMADIAVGYDLTVAFEFHRGTYNDRGERTIKLLGDIDRANVRTYWQRLYLGADLENLRLIGKNLVAVHVFSGNRLEMRYPLRCSHRVLTEVSHILREGGFTGHVYLEFTRRGSPKCFAEDYKYLTTCGIPTGNNQSQNGGHKHA